MAKKEVNITHFVWIDCEMTGLDIAKDVLLEIATIITDTNLTIVAEGPDLVIHQPESALIDMIPIVQELHASSGLIQEVRASTVSLDDAQQQTYAFIEQHCEQKNYVSQYFLEEVQMKKRYH